MIVNDPKGGFKVVSESGRNLGGGLSKAGAHKRLGQVEWFKKHKGKGGGDRKVPKVSKQGKPKGYGGKKGKQYGMGYLKSYGKGK
jgi:hypothetical protein